MNDLQHLARVRDEDLSGRVSGAGARALLASITEEPVAATGRAADGRGRFGGLVAVGGRRRTGRLLVAAGAVAAVAAAAVVGPAVLGGGQATSYASSAIDIELRGDYYVASIKDPLADYAQYTKGFKAVGLNVRLEPVPSSPSQVGKVIGMSGVGGPTTGPVPTSIGSGTEPAGCTLGRPGCVMTLTVGRQVTGDALVKLGRPAQAGEKYQNIGSATGKGEMLEGYDPEEKTVGEVLAEARRRSVGAVFRVITPAPDYNGFRFDPDGQKAKVGDDWIVWRAESEQAGVLRLLVTKDRLPQNPTKSTTN
ncbi:hypothetical protein [Nonomuraea jiangxiensis]|uniref:Uncharacterized protein n=1 Tax=Nonomuraea jiangxiensis TaxID=633440 RepID=A0A1G9NLL4_9ACTN|nr:hypothetical protein [Nonomuraea jiangxiensis]SDL87260.1 hypothetical protein SAMN05421869_13229 [Nonomuraea jiangxiensis]